MGLKDFFKRKQTKVEEVDQEARGKELMQAVCSDLDATFKVELGDDGQETPESFVARMDATRAMSEKLMALAQIPGSGVSVCKNSIFGETTEDDIAYGKFLHAKYNSDKETIRLKNIDSTGSSPKDGLYHHLTPEMLAKRGRRGKDNEDLII
jgi:hypothetical protein